MLKLLKVLNGINTFALSWYLIYIVLFYDDFFISKEQAGLQLVGIALFITTFICGGVTIVVAIIKDVDTQMPVKKIKNLPKFWAVICIIEAVLLIIFVRDAIVIWYVACLVISYGFVSMEKFIAPAICESNCYKIILPIWIYPIPFALFIGGNIYLSDRLPEEIFEKVSIAIFIFCGIFMVCTVWCGYYMIDEDSKIINKNYGVISEITNKNKIIRFEDIRFYEKRLLYYLIHTDNDEIKISRLYTNSKRIEKTLEKVGVPKQTI